MKHLALPIALVLVAATGAGSSHASFGTSDPPAAADSAHPHLFAAGYHAYIYLSPAMDFFHERAKGVNDDKTDLSTLSAECNVPVPDGHNEYVNQFYYSTQLSSCTNPVVRPDNGHLYAVSWVDLTNGPVKIHVPEISDEVNGDLSYAVQFLDTFGNNFFHVAPWGNGPSEDGSVGSKGLGPGNYGVQDYYLIWDQDVNRDHIIEWAREQPDYSGHWVAVQKMAWVLGRVVIDDDNINLTRAICRNFCATAYYSFGPGGSPSFVPQSQYETNPMPVNFPVGCDDADGDLLPLAYLDRAAKVMRWVVIPPESPLDAVRAAQLQSIGIGNYADQTPEGPTSMGFSQSQLDAIVDGFNLAKRIICGDGEHDGFNSHEDFYRSNGNGWLTPPVNVGDYGQDFLLRAFIAKQGLGAETPTYEFYPTASKYVSNGHFARLQSKHDGESQHYLLAIDSSIDQATAEWSLCMYQTDDEKSYARILCECQNPSAGLTDIRLTTDIGTDHKSWVNTDGLIKPDGSDCYYVLLSPDVPDLAWQDYINWLPAPYKSGDQDGACFPVEDIYFEITLRAYNARVNTQGHVPYFLNGWETPEIIKLPSLDIDLASYLDCIGDSGAGCEGDLAPNGIVDVVDLMVVLNSWGSDCGECVADLDGNGVVDIRDLLDIIDRWGTTCE